MVVTGIGAAICPVGIAGFSACKSLSANFNETPEKASRLYDKDRDGFVMGEGSVSYVRRIAACSLKKC